MAKQTKVLVLWDEVANVPRGRTHALDCNWALVFESKLGKGRHHGYREIPVDQIPPSTDRCSRCCGGR